MDGIELHIGSVSFPLRGRMSSRDVSTTLTEKPRGFSLGHTTHRVHQLARSGDFTKFVVHLNECEDRVREVNARNENGGATPLMFSAAHGHVDIVKMLLGCGADVHTATTLGGYTCLHYAAFYDENDIVKLLLSQSRNGRLASSRSKINNETALHLACKEGNVDVVRTLLIDGKCDPNAVTVAMGWSPIHMSSHAGNLEITRLLIENGANVLLRTRQGYTAASIASTKYSAVKRCLESRMHEVMVSLLATDACSAQHCVCCAYKEREGLHVCECGHDPISHCARKDEAMRLLSTTGILEPTFCPRVRESKEATETKIEALVDDDEPDGGVPKDVTATDETLSAK